ncbi:MAG: peptide deformylase [Rhodospirillales bacterium]|nr:peptide deformylase [Rhodospirillales bacterium]
MAILKIARLGHPVLKRRAEEVDNPSAPEIASLVEDMVDTMIDSGGVGLAAPQVHVSKQLVIFHVPLARTVDERYKDAGLDEDEGKVPLTVMINPVIEPLGEDKAVAFEGCLSIPDMTGAVSRHTHIRYRYTDLEGRLVEGEAKGFHARVIQHECDHLEGVLYPQRIEDMTTFGFSEEIRKYALGRDDTEEDE